MEPAMPICLPEGVIFQILSKLPVKSVVRFMSVCRSWQTLITSSHFIASHLSNAKAGNLFSTGAPFLHNILYNLDEETGEFQLLISFRLEDPSDCYGFRIVGNCDGLLCLSFIFDTVEVQSQVNLHFGNRNPIIIWNPCIRKHVLLPIPTIEPEYYSNLGFGATERDYKVVRIVDFVFPNIEVEIYSLSSGTWGRVPIDGSYRGVLHCWDQCLVKGSLHWILFYVEEVGTCRILSLDLDQEVFKVMLFPHNLCWKSTDTLSISVVGEALGAIDHDDCLCSIWVMKEYGVVDSWTKLYKIDFSESGVTRVFELISVRKNSDLVMLVCASKQEILITYDPKTGKVKKDFENQRGLLHVGRHVESLVLLERNSVEETLFII